MITNLPVGGAQDNTLLTVEHLDRSKYEIALLCARDGEWLDRAAAIDHLKLIFVDELVRPIHPVKDVIAFFKVYRELKRGAYDIVHTHSSKPGVIGRIAAKMADVPIIIHTIHGFPFNNFMNPFVRKLVILLERYLSRLTDKLITVSTLNLKKAIKLGFAPPERFHNIYSGIDFCKFDQPTRVSEKKTELGILNGEKIVGMVGRLSRQKAPLDFIRAIPSVIERLKDVRFVMVGDGELRDITLETARRLGVEDRLMVLGSRSDVPDLLKTFDLYVLTSHWEGLGRSLTEAMYTGRPVVATNVEGVPELVRNGETGMLVEPRNIQAIADAIVQVLQDPELAARLGRAGRQKITESFQYEKMVKEIEFVYDELMRLKGPNV